jgi:sugar phosphate isomerase/epimerase
VAAKGFDCVQLAPAKALADFAEGAGGRIDPGYAAGVAAALSAQGVRVAVIGCYINPIHPDPAARRAGLLRFKASLAACAAFGCGIVATETGSLNADCSFHPGNGGEEAFMTLVASVAELAEAAEAAGMTACIEGVVRHVASSPARLARVLKEVASPSLKVILDPVNFLDKSNMGRSREVVDEAFDLLGPDILALHAKDCAQGDQDCRILPPGQGILDYGHILGRLAEANPQADILIEDLRPEDMEGARAHVAGLLGRQDG